MDQSEGSVVGAVIAGFVVALVCAVLWGVISVVTGYQIGWIAIGVGFAVGITVQLVGKGQSASYGIIGGILALISVVMGNYFSIAGYLSKHSAEVLGGEISAFSALRIMISNPDLSISLMKATFSPMDVLFYVLALYMGFKCSYRDPNATS